MKYENKLDNKIEIIWDKFTNNKVIKIKEFYPDSNMIKSIKTFELIDNLNFLK